MPQEARFSGSYRGGKYFVKVILQLFSWEEDDIYFIYSPAMDLTGYGKSKKEAEKSFGITMGESLKYMENKSTMFDELERLGWMVNRKKKKVQAPDVETLISENAEFAEIYKRPGVKMSDKSLEIELV